MPHLGQNISAVSMESIGFSIIGGDVGTTQYRAGTRTVHTVTAPLPLGTVAVRNRGYKAQFDRSV